MSFRFARSIERHARVIIATIAVVVIAASTMLAQFGAFQAQHEGQLWGVRQELPSSGGYPVGSVFVGGTLFVADQGDQQVLAYNTTTWAPINVSAGDWNDVFTVGAPAYGLVVNEMAIATVNGNDAILISDLAFPRVMAFDTTGAHLFTLRLDNPNGTPDDTNPLINGVAMGPGASFTLASGNLSLSGALAVGWTNSGRTKGVALGYRDASFTLSPSGYTATPEAVMDGTEGAGVGPVAFEIYGVTFDTLGNLYTVDTLTERINVYDSANRFAHRFRFGTPATDNGVEQFSQPFGLAFWPDANGGRLFVADALNNRIAVYRPNLAGNTLDFLTSIDRLAPAVDPQIYSMAVDPAAGMIAAADFQTPSLWILKTADLVAYNLQVLDAGGAPADMVCAGANYQVRFSITVPAGHPDAADVLPLLTVNGTPVTGSVPFDSYPAAPMQAGQVATYTFPLTMPANASGDLAVLASASSPSTNDVLSSPGFVAASSCPADNDAPVITMSQSPAAQVSGWTPVFGNQVTELTLSVSDDEALQRLEYRITGANDTGQTIPPVVFSGSTTSESVTIQLPEAGETVIEYRARDNHNVWSAWQSTTLRIIRVLDRQSNEGDQNTFTVGSPVGSGYQFSATNLPPGASIDANTGQISGMLLFDAAGVYNITLTETLGAASSSVNFTWTVLNVNRHPTIVQLQSSDIPTMVEGAPMAPIQVIGSDPDGDTVFWTAYGRSIPLGYELPPGVAIDPLSGIISGTFPMDSERSYNITVGLSECAASPRDHPVVCAGALPRTGLATLMEIVVNVANVNQPPDIIDPGDKVNTEGETIAPLPIVASDPDVAFGDDVDFEAEGLPPGLSIDVETGLITGTVASNAGPHVYAVVVRARDNTAAQPLPFETFNWAILDSPDPTPTISSVDQFSNEGDTVSYVVTAVDPDGDPLTYSMTGTLPATHSINPATGAITGTFSFVSAGGYTITVTATDGDHTVSTTFRWTVREVNRPPVIDTVNQFNMEGDSPSYQISASDPDGDSLVWTATGVPAGLSFSSTGVMSGTWGFNSAGVYPDINVAVCDALLCVTKSFTWTVGNLNRPPVVTAVPDRTDYENDTVGFQVLASDPDGDRPLTYSATGLPQGASINPLTGEISGTLTYTSSGIFTVTITVTDPNGAASSVTFTWTVINVNRPPVVTHPDRLNAENDTVPGYASTASDPDGDTLTFSATGLPAGITINPSTGTLSGYLGYNTAGTYNPTITVSDGSLTGSHTFRWVVTETNAPPVLDNPGPQLDHENDTISRQFTATDEDTTGLTFSATGLPPGLIMSSTGLVTGYVPYTAAGVYTVTMTVTDGTTSRTVTFTWTIIDVNRPPTVFHADRTNVENDTVSYPTTASDPDGDSLTFTATGLPPNISINPVTGQLTGTLGYNTAGTYTPTITVRDEDGASASHTFTWIVTDVNRPPDAVNDAATVNQGQSVTVNVLNLDSDPDGDTLTVTSITQPAEGSAVLNANGSVTYTAPVNFVGTTTFTYTISDGKGGTDTATVTITVQAVNCTTTGYTTYSQGGWGNNGAPGQLMRSNFARVYPSGYVVIGGGNTLTFTSAAAITVFLPQGGTPAMLTASLVNPTGSSAGNFAAQVLALRLAVDYSRAGVLKAGLGELVMVSGPLAGQSVNQVLAIANAVLGGSATALPIGMTISGLNTIVEALNLNFHEVDTNGGLLACPNGYSAPPPPTANRAPDAVNDVTSVNQGQSVVINVKNLDSDPDGDPITVTSVSTPSVGTAVLNANGTVTYTPPPTFAGTATFNYTISDGRGGTDTATVTITVVGNQAPVCTAARGGEIWPPNHKRFYVAPVSGVTDPDGNPVTITVTGVWQDELIDSTGDGKFSPDARIEGGRAWIRAERNGHNNKAVGNGRVYEILFTATDSRGGSCTGSVLWSVPHDQGQRPEAIDNGVRYDSLGVIAGARNKWQIHQNSPQ